MQMLQHKQGVSGSMLASQSKFNEFVKFDPNDAEGKRIPGSSRKSPLTIRLRRLRAIDSSRESSRQNLRG